MLSPDKKTMTLAIEKVKSLRRNYSHMVEAVLDSEDNYECEDLLRLVGHLQASYDHLLASRVRDNDIYCVIAKHLPAALILAGEIGYETGPIYEIMSILTNSKIKPCSACEKDKKNVQIL